MGIICRAISLQIRYHNRMATDEIRLDSTRTPEMAVSPPKPAKFHWALTALGIATILGLCYWAELVLAVMMFSVMLAFILAPVVDFLLRCRVARGVAALISVILLVAIVAALLYYTSNQAATFFQDVPQYAGKIRTAVMNFRQRAESFGGLRPQEQSGRSSTDWTGPLMRGVGSVTQGLVAASFVPFLVYFMLTWQHHVRSATVMLFSLKNRQTAYVTLGLISAMIRTFMVGNLLIGLFLGTASTIAFAILGLPFFYFIGFISGFLSLVPYLGVVLAMAPPFFVSIGHISSGDAVVVVMVVLGLHLIALNVLYPKFLGNRLQLNPLAVTIALLVWGWLWGGIGLLLAIPITAAMKIVFDHVQSLKPYGAWLGE